MVSSFLYEFLIRIEVLSSTYQSLVSCQNEHLITHVTIIWNPVF